VIKYQDNLAQAGAKLFIPEQFPQRDRWSRRDRSFQHDRSHEPLRRDRSDLHFQQALPRR